MYFKVVHDGIVELIGYDSSSYGNITEAQYNELSEIIKNRPEAPAGHSYYLSEDLTWVMKEDERASAGNVDEEANK